MPEEVLKKVSRKERQQSIITVLKKGEMERVIGKPTTYSLNPLFDFIAEMMKNAYIAGANRGRKEIEDTGEILVSAINHTKDKGFKV